MSGVAGVSGKHRPAAAARAATASSHAATDHETHSGCRTLARIRRLATGGRRSAHVGSTTTVWRQRRDEHKGAHHCGSEGAQKARIKRRHAVRSTGSIPAPSESPVPPASRAAGAARRSQGAKATSGNSLVTVGQILMATDRGPVCEEAAPHGTVEDRPIAECRLMIRGVWSIPTRRTGQRSVADVVCGGCGRFGSWRRDARGGSTCDRFRRIGDSSRARCGRAGECRRCTASWIST